METTPRFPCMDRSSRFSCEQLQQLRKCFDPNPNKETPEALAEASKLTKDALGTGSSRRGARRCSRGRLRPARTAKCAAATVHQEEPPGRTPRSPPKMTLDPKLAFIETKRKAINYRSHSWQKCVCVTSEASQMLLIYFYFWSNVYKFTFLLCTFSEFFLLPLLGFLQRSI